ncbi:hypothetical protein PHMEG_00027488 [Phytophthora megakarya]|uniref:Uncharacterized protein n=1 Tax=Phytophthora megakarya TaxID=4795 RepID=A0A225V9R6_9STRA|nr:hypothetical protein PHMEG_00027488 [Phytophthora megakarya]
MEEALLQQVQPLQIFKALELQSLHCHQQPINAPHVHHQLANAPHEGHHSHRHHHRRGFLRIHYACAHLPKELQLHKLPEATGRMSPSTIHLMKNRSSSLLLGSEGDQHVLRLVVAPIVKSTVGQRDATGRHLEIFAASGASFADIMHKLWDKFSGNIKGQAVKTDDTWSLETSTEASWSNVMQLKVNGRIASATKTPELWNKWIVDQKNNPVTLSIYEYGQAVSNARLLEEFLQACI